jgi:hypothetical protein
MTSAFALFLILAASYRRELKRHPQDRHRHQQFHFHRKDKPYRPSEVAARKTSLVISRSTA